MGDDFTDLGDDVLDEDLREPLENGNDESGTETDTDRGFDERVRGKTVAFSERARENTKRFGATLRSTQWLTGLRAILYAVLVVPIIIFSPVVRALPMTWKLYHKLHVWSAWQMQRAAGADALANVRRPNGPEDVLPAAYVEADGNENGRSGWKIKGVSDKRYDPAVHGGASSRLGKADLIHVNEDDLEQGTWTEATIDAAFQLDREKYLFRDATVDIYRNVIQTDPKLNDGSGAPVADGGVNVDPTANVNTDGDGLKYRVASRQATLSRPGVLEDVLVPLQSRTGYDGQVISWNQYSNLKNEQADQETVRDAKNAGWMAAKLDDIGKADLFKWAIILGIGGLILLFHQDIGAAISSFGGSGGGGSVAPTAGLGVLPLLKRRFGGE